MIQPTTHGDVTLYQADCLEVLPTLPAASVDLVLTDPPYFRVVDEPWDRQWEDPQAFLAWLARVVDECARIMKPNASLYLFASSTMAAQVEAVIAKRLAVLNHITWVKRAPGRKLNCYGSRTKKEALRAYFPVSERVLFAEHFGADSMALGESGYAAQCEQARGLIFEPIRAYLDAEWARAGLTPEDANAACGTASMARHYFTRSQWCLPTEEAYAKLYAYANRTTPAPEYLRRQYEDLRRQYEDLRRPFNLTACDQWGDVWDFDPVPGYDGKHPCEKPQALLRHVLRASTKLGQPATILDPFVGGGSLLEAAHAEGHRVIGMEQCAKNHAKAINRYRAVSAQLQLAL